MSEKILHRKQYSVESIAYIGNDINDYEAMRIAGLKIVPQDAYGTVKDIADYVTETKGGHGVIREVADVFYKFKNLRPDEIINLTI